MSKEKRILDYIPQSLHKQLREEVLEEIEAEKEAEKNRPRTPAEELAFQRQIDEILNRL